MRLGLWSLLDKHLPKRREDYSWREVIESMIAGLLTGGRGTFATQDLRDGEGRMELGYQELLSDLGPHHPPCREHQRNAGFYSVATLAHTLGAAVKLIGSQAGGAHRREQESLKAKRDGVPPRTHVRPRRGMRLWRVRRRFFALPGRVSRHARRLKAVLLGTSASVREQFERWHSAICRCRPTTARHARRFPWSNAFFPEASPQPRHSGCGSCFAPPKQHNPHPESKRTPRLKPNRGRRVKDSGRPPRLPPSLDATQHL